MMARCGIGQTTDPRTNKQCSYVNLCADCRFHNYLEHPSLVSWALSEKLTLLRTAMVMAKGRYEHDAWPKKGYVVTPSSEGW